MVHRTMQGREIDLNKLIRANELTPAVGNMNVNARGDQLGAGGQIVKKREDVVAEYYDTRIPKRKQPVETKTEQPAPVTNKKTKPAIDEEEDE